MFGEIPVCKGKLSICVPTMKRFSSLNRVNLRLKTCKSPRQDEAREKPTTTCASAHLSRLQNGFRASCDEHDAWL